jgi:hypothetical protein
MYRVGSYCYDLNPSSPVALGGMVATFTGNREIGLCSPDTVPVGFFMNDTNSMDPYESVGFGDTKATIAVGGELQTDVFEPGTYQVNDFLYCSHNGKISNDSQYRGNIIVGIVNYVESRLIGFLTCLTRGLDISGGMAPMKKMTRFQILKNTCNNVQS